jgi:hypothetical protein
MHDNPEEVIRAELGPREELLWAGRARQGFVMRYHYALCITVGIPLGSVMIFRIATDPSMFIITGATLSIIVSQILGLVCALCTLLGVLYMLVGGIVGFVWDIFRRKWTYYGVTSERIVIVSVLPKEVKTLRLAMLTDVWLKERANGAGIISFGPAEVGHPWGSDLSGLDVIPNLELPSDVGPVYELILAAELAAKRRASDRVGLQNEEIMVQLRSIQQPSGDYEEL